MYRARAARAGPEPGSPGRFGILSTGQLRDLLQDEPKLDRIVRLSRKEQMEQLLLGEQSLEAFLPAFQRGRALAHLRRTQAEKLQELLRRRERSGAGQPAPSAPSEPPKAFPAAAAVLPTGAARGPPPAAAAVPRSLPPLDSRPVPPLKASPGCPLGPAPLLSPRPSQPEPPHR
ncbi:vacuolar protein sorting-associated protein 37D isoform X2 [Ochotona curzoniae]|uniref:vacuolar protein sorting-associated protein 37D isoform X2 n=1 Tax=Ochotona curzoniae TaxID=130825 RepID=UPI001B34F541|nr:vacuolar protein sorting-associated protein 37D isoform X2 [Ochotona curzoniae]XP_040853701.1 vacuolar protein sorting-associated protein 37D isoform X2 [Ochotona curzoniae]